jgi:hypothetical protein
MTRQQVGHIAIFLSLFIICGCAVKPDLAEAPNSAFNGVWVGTMVQPNGPRGQEGYDQFLRLRVRRSSAEGIARIEIRDTDFFAEMKVSGTFRNDSLFFTEDSIMTERAREGHWWCLKKGILILDRKTMSLAGEWHSRDCASGKIELHRIFENWNKRETHRSE